MQRKCHTVCRNDISNLAAKKVTVIKGAPNKISHDERFVQSVPGLYSMFVFVYHVVIAVPIACLPPTKRPLKNLQKWLPPNCVSPYCQEAFGVCTTSVVASWWWRLMAIVVPRSW